MTEPKQMPVAGPWALALAIFGRWQNTFAVIVIVLLLGWPAMVMKQWGADAGLWASLGITEQASRELEHQRQDKIHEVMADALGEQAHISKEILVELKSHNIGAATDRQMLGYFTWKQCVADNGKAAEICKQFQRVVSESHGH